MAGREDEGESDDQEEDDPDDIPSSTGSMRKSAGQGMAYERSTVSHIRMASMQQKQTKQRKSEIHADHAIDPARCKTVDADSLRRHLVHQFGNCTHGWREILDERQQHYAGWADFSRALRHLGYVGDIKKVWMELSGQHGRVTLADLDPAAEQAMRNFYNAYTAKGDSLSSLVDACPNLRISRKQFLETCKKLEREPRELQLDKVFTNVQSGHGYMTAADCEWLGHHCRHALGKSQTGGKEDGSGKEDKAEEDEEEDLITTEHARKRSVRDFRRLLQHRFGGFVRPWREVMDSEGSGEISFEELEEATTTFGFKGDIESLWDGLVGNSGYGVRLEDLEPMVKVVLPDFKAMCVKRFGSVVRAFEELEAAEKPLVTKQEFLRWCRELLCEHPHLLFDLLDTRGADTIQLTTIDETAAHKAFGKTACQHSSEQYLKLPARPRLPGRISLRDRAKQQSRASRRPKEALPSHRQELLRVLEQRFGSPARAWHCAFDPRGTGKIKCDDFIVGCAAAGYTGSKTALCAELGLKPSSSVRLKTIAPEALEECRNFRSIGQLKLGDLLNAKEANKDDPALTPKSSKHVSKNLDKEEFADLCKKLGYSGSAPNLYAHFDPSREGFVASRSLKWIQDCRNEDKALPELLAKHREHKRQQWRNKLADQVVPPKSELLKTQDKVREAGKKKVSAKHDFEKFRQEVLGKLNKRFGSLARAWHLAIDPQDKGSVNRSQWWTGLRRAGIMKDGADPEVQLLAERLFDALDTEDAGTISIGDLDPDVPKLLQELRMRCIARYGSIALAFQNVDPEGTGSISIAKFRNMLQDTKFTNAVHRLIAQLDPHGSDEIPLRQIDEEAAQAAAGASEKLKEVRETKQKYDKKKRAHMLKEPPDFGSKTGVEARDEKRETQKGQQLLAELKRRLQHKYGTLVRAWRKLLNPEGKRHIGEKEIANACSAAGVEGDPVEVWAALNAQSNGLSLTQFDPGISDDIRELRARLTERYGSIENAFDEVDTDNSFQLDKTRFHNMCHECHFRRNHNRLFAFYDKKDSGTVSMNTIDHKAVGKVKQRRDDVGTKHKHKVKEASVDGEDDEVDKDTKSDGEPSDAASHVPSLPLHRDPARALRQIIQKRFNGSSIRAWQALDHAGLAVLHKKEFLAALPAIGYGGSPSLLWEALVEKEQKKISLREFDPQGFQLLAEFRLQCVNELTSFRKAFEDKSGAPVKRLSFEGFSKLCRRVELPKPWDPLFQQLDVKGNASITWDDVKFLDEQFDWQDGEGEPIRRKTNEPKLTGNLPGSPGRAQGVGPLSTSMRPRQVGMQKASSLPDIRQQLRATWNDRHQISDTPHNKDTQLIHMTTCVLTQGQERIKQRVAKKIEDTPTEDWLQQHMAQQAESDEDSDDA